MGETTAEKTSEVASTAVEGGRWVAAVGQDEAKTVASTAADQVGQVAGEVGTQARHLLHESTAQLHTQAQMQTGQLASKLRELGDQVQALVEGRTTDAGAVGDYARQAAQTVTHLASRVEDRGFDGIVADVQRFARRKPGTFLLGAAIAGFGVGRLLRSGAMSTTSTTSTASTSSNDTGRALGSATDAGPDVVDVRPRTEPDLEPEPKLLDFGDVPTEVRTGPTSQTEHAPMPPGAIR